MMRSSFKCLLLSAFLLQALLPEQTQAACPEMQITESWNGGYKATFKASAPSSDSGLTIKLTFDNAVSKLEVWSLDLVYQDSTHFTLQNVGWGVNQGDGIEFIMVITCDPQANVIAVEINGVATCGNGGGPTDNPPPTDSSCDGTGTGPYDYKQALCMSFLFFEAQRSGHLPDDQRVTWRWDSAMGDGDDVGLDLTGGWYDAGDHVKFGFPMAYTTTVLAWGMIKYEAGYAAAGQLDWGRAGIKWATDYFLKCHSAGYTLYGQLGQGDADHAYWGRPEEMTMYRPAYKIDSGAPGSDLAAETAAALAATSIVFKDVDAGYSKQCLDAAKDLLNFANEHRATYDSSITDAANYYKSWSGYGDELAWGAAWVYKASNDPGYLTMARAFYDEFGMADYADQFGWDDKRPGVRAMLAELDGGDRYRGDFDSWTGHIRNEVKRSPGGMLYLDQWGTLRHAANVAFLLQIAADMGLSTDANRQLSVDQLHYILGSQGHSFVVGFGNNPPQRPHHRSSSCPDAPAACDGGWAATQGGPNPQVLYGALVGGPDEWDNYSDDRQDYVHNEVACDYNAAFTGLLAAVIAHM